MKSFLLLIPLLAFSAPHKQDRQVPLDVPSSAKADTSPLPSARQSTGVKPDTATTAVEPTPPADYVLGSFDQITVAVGELKDEFDDKTFRIDGNGDVSLPMAGRLHAGGLTLQAFEAEIKKHLIPILKDPDVVVNVTEFNSQTVSVLGAVNLPGIHQLVGQKSLFEMLSLSQGLSEDAGTTVKITRALKWNVIPLPGVVTDPTGQVSTATVRVKDVALAGPENIAVMPGDTLFVPKADLVYVVGSVTKPGGFRIGEKETLSALQVVSLAQGLQKTAAANKAKILRVVPGNPTRMEIPVNVKQLMAGKTIDVPLQADDILFIPNSDAKSTGYRTIDAIVNAATGFAMYGARY